MSYKQTLYVEVIDNMEASGVSYLPVTCNMQNGLVSDLEAYARRQWDWSAQTFGPGERTGGITQHIEKECTEIRAKPHDLSEWVDVMILAMDGFWRHGGKPEDLMPMLQAKQDKNFSRNWPDWRNFSADQAIEHDRSGE